MLEIIALRTRERMAEKKAQIPLEKIREMAKTMPIGTFPFQSAIDREDIAFICEIKRASPSKGIIAPEFPYLEIAKEYEKAGAAAISVLTEPHYFEGHDQNLQEISKLAEIPLLRKDFTIDPYMIYEAKYLGAAAILLICALLDEKTLETYLQLARDLGLSALVEAHDEREVEIAIAAGAEIIGINNRNLKTFQVDLGLSARLRDKVPPEILFVAESGIQGPEDVESFRKIGVNAVLVGESLMKSLDKGAKLAYLRGRGI